MSRLFLIRHGKPAASWGEADSDPGLDDAGRAQAQAARDYLMSLPAEQRPSKVVSSPLRRCRETAMPTAEQRPSKVVSSPLRRCRETAMPTAEALGVEIEIDPAVGEIPTPANLSNEARPAWLREAFAGRWQDIVGELDYDQWRRGGAASLIARGGTAVFSHYVAINAVVSTLENDDRVLTFRPDHTSITTLESDGKTLILIEKGREASTGVL